MSPLASQSVHHASRRHRRRLSEELVCRPRVVLLSDEPGLLIRVDEPGLQDLVARVVLPVNGLVSLELRHDLDLVLAVSSSYLLGHVVVCSLIHHVVDCCWVQVLVHRLKGVGLVQAQSCHSGLLRPGLDLRPKAAPEVACLLRGRGVGPQDLLHLAKWLLDLHRHNGRRSTAAACSSFACVHTGLGVVRRLVSVHPWLRSG